ncbi:GntR family transcriptional regulator [Acidimangrovimonas pyrenivorans]|uniref:GntR family transcriptional regulator n=1 Tax=Acidimangrovimonas pyrenivorans TaxID=2030798 RepID=A0ABV7AF99_9RHOB
MAGSDEATEGSEGGQGHQAYLRLVDEIRRGELMPGARLRETQLAERMGISRTPVREAIRTLEAEGLVTHLPRQGAVIRVLDRSEVMELYEMRAVLEGTAARMAARAASEIELDELASVNEELARFPDSATTYRLNRHFHAILLDAARNRYLIKASQALQKTLLILGPSTLTDPARAAEAVQEHGVLLDALRGRDGARAEAAMRAHIEAAHRARLRGFRLAERPLDEG